MSTQADRQLSMRLAVVEAIAEEMRRDSDVFYIGEDVGEAEGVFKQTEGLFKEFGNKRVIDTPISEAGMMGVTVGSAMAGCGPLLRSCLGIS